MGLIKTRIDLSNASDPDKKLSVDALVDTGALHLCIPDHVRQELGLNTLEQRNIITADGKTHKADYVGMLKVQFANRTSWIGAMVLGNEVLLGAIPMEDMDLVIHPTSRSVAVNPESPNIPTSIAMGLPG